MYSDQNNTYRITARWWQRVICVGQTLNPLAWQRFPNSRISILSDYIHRLARLITLQCDFKMEEDCEKVEQTAEADKSSKNTESHR